MKNKSKDVYVLPPYVTDQINKIKTGDFDWTMFKADDGNMWLVAKLWDDPQHYNVIAAVVKYESQSIDK